MKQLIVIVIISILVMSCGKVDKGFSRKENAIPFCLDAKGYEDCPVISINVSSNPFVRNYYSFLVDTGCEHSNFFDEKDENNFIILNFLNNAFEKKNICKTKKN